MMDFYYAIYERYSDPTFMDFVSLSAISVVLFLADKLMP